MVIFNITDIKQFMNQLLIQDTFDQFLLVSATISTAHTVHIDGHINANFYSEDEQALRELTNLSYHPWHLLKPLCLNHIKGKHTPSSFKFVFLLSPENTKKTLAQLQVPFSLEDVTGLCLNITYHNQQLHCITGTSLASFSMDKSLESGWDEIIHKFLKKHTFSFEPL